MKIISPMLLAAVFFTACNNGTVPVNATGGGTTALNGTWQLISGTTIEKGDTTVTWYTKDLAFIKVINNSHFAFLKHDLTKGKDSSTRAFGAGGGVYTLKDSVYTEHLEYCSDREWEGNDFVFTIYLLNDTLVQSGVEKVEGAGVNRLNIEKYIRVKN
jgi:hypothetical protein